MPRSPRVVVIGGGIGGLTAAQALVQKGCEVRVYEAAPELKEIGAGVALGPNAMKVLRSLGLEERIRAIGWEREQTVSRHWRTGRIVRQSSTSRADTIARYGASGCSIHRADMLDTLANSLPSSVDIHLGMRGVWAGTEGASAIAKFADGSEAEGDVVIGADGIHSKVREALFGPDAPRFTGKVCYRSVIPVDTPELEDLRDGGGSFGPHGTIVIYGVRRGELVNVVCHHDDEHYKHESWITECPKEEVLYVYRRWSDRLLRLLSASEVWYKWALYDRDPIPTWTVGRVSVLGDAAHAMLPYLGQGACQALEDAVVLANALERVPDDLPGALQLYERVRRPRASRVVLAARDRGVDNHLVSPIAAWKRDTLIALRKRFTHDVGGRGDAWIPAYDASAPEVFAPA
ncbi:MAG: FAD-dependent monooxygenase [Acidimicrobiaceae bacterium]|nr:FAD-dependent monooxygenase [Acidimicrobiaceae bacterium]